MAFAIQRRVKWLFDEDTEASPYNQPKRLKRM